MLLSIVVLNMLCVMLVKKLCIMNVENGIEIIV